MSAVCGYCETEIDPVNNINGYCSKQCKELEDRHAYRSKHALYHDGEELELTKRQITLLEFLYDAIDENDYHCGSSPLDNVVAAICGNPKAAIEFAKTFIRGGEER